MGRWRHLRRRCYVGRFQEIAEKSAARRASATRAGKEESATDSKRMHGHAKIGKHHTPGQKKEQRNAKGDEERPLQYGSTLSDSHPARHRDEDRCDGDRVNNYSQHHKRRHSKLQQVLIHCFSVIPVDAHGQERVVMRFEIRNCLPGTAGVPPASHGSA